MLRALRIEYPAAIYQVLNPGDRLTTGAEYEWPILKKELNKLNWSEEEMA